MRAYYKVTKLKINPTFFVLSIEKDLYYVYYILMDIAYHIKMEVFQMEILKVSSKSAPNSVAGAIAAVIREKGCVEIQAVGASAINQAIKAIIIARGYLAPTGVELVCIPAFVNIDIEGEERTAIKLVVETKNGARVEATG